MCKAFKASVLSLCTAHEVRCAALDCLNLGAFQVEDSPLGMLSLDTPLQSSPGKHRPAAGWVLQGMQVTSQQPRAEGRP